MMNNEMKKGKTRRKRRKLEKGRVRENIEIFSKKLETI